MERIRNVLGLEPVEYPTTRRLRASAADRAADVNAAFADPDIKAIFASVGGDDQITVVPHLDAQVVKANPKPFLGYSDNTNMLNWLWQLGVPAYYGGSTQVHIGAGPGIDDVHLQSLRAALFRGGEIELFEPGEAEDFGPDWLEPAALTDYGDREPTEPWVWGGPQKVVSGKTWGGCLEVLDGIALADRLPSTDQVKGSIMLFETSEGLPAAEWVYRWLRGLGERGFLQAAAGVLVARPPASTHGHIPGAEQRAEHRAEQLDVVQTIMGVYNPEAPYCVGVPFGHTRPQWIVPYGGQMTLDGKNKTVTADYS